MRTGWSRSRRCSTPCCGCVRLGGRGGNVLFHQGTDLVLVAARRGRMTPSSAAVILELHEARLVRQTADRNRSGGNGSFLLEAVFLRPVHVSRFSRSRLSNPALVSGAGGAMERRRVPAVGPLRLGGTDACRTDAARRDVPAELAVVPCPAQRRLHQPQVHSLALRRDAPARGAVHVRAAARVGAQPLCVDFRGRRLRLRRLRRRDRLAADVARRGLAAVGFPAVPSRRTRAIRRGTLAVRHTLRGAVGLALLSGHHQTPIFMLLGLTGCFCSSLGGGGLLASASPVGAAGISRSQESHSW